MPKYTGFQAILNAALGDFAGMGFRLEETNDHTLDLYFGIRHVASFTQRVSTMALQTACRNFLYQLGRGADDDI